MVKNNVINFEELAYEFQLKKSNILTLRIIELLIYEYNLSEEQAINEFNNFISFQILKLLKNNQNKEEENEK